MKHGFVWKIRGKPSVNPSVNHHHLSVSARSHCRPWRPQFLASVKNAAVQGALLLKAPLAVPRSPLLVGGQNRNRNNTLQLATCLAIKWLVAWERVDINTVRLQPLQGYGVPVWVEHSRTTSHKVLGWATTKRKQLPCKVSLASSAFSCFSGFSDWEDRGSSAGCPLVEGSVGGSKVSFADGRTKQKQERNNTLQLATCLAIKWLVAWERVDINTVRLQPLQGYGVPVWVEHSQTTSHKVLGSATTKRKQLPCKVSLASSAFSSCFFGFSDWEDRGSSAGCPLVEGSVGGSKVSFADGRTKQKQERNNTLQLATCLAIKWLVAWERVDINTVRLQPLQGYGVPVWVEHSRTTSHKVLGSATTKRKQLPCKVSLASSAFSCFSGFSDWEDRGSSAGCPLVEGSVGGSKVSFADGWTKQKQE